MYTVNQSCTRKMGISNSEYIINRHTKNAKTFTMAARTMLFQAYPISQIMNTLVLDQ